MNVSEELPQCRACLSQSDEMYPLFEPMEDVILADILNGCSDLNVSDYGNFPNMLCKDCANLLLQFYEFKQMFTQNQTYISSMLKFEEEETCSVSEIEPPQVEQSEKQQTESADSEVESMETIALEVDDIKKELSSAEVGENIMLEFVDLEEPGTSNKITKTELKYECLICRLQLCSMKTLRKHFTKHDTKELEFKPIEVEISDRFVCEYCDSVVESSKDLRLHMTTEHSTFVCEECGASYKRKSYLKDHYRAVHTNDFSYECDVCQKKFKLRSLLWRHKQKHSFVTFMCDNCGKSFSHKDNLTTHIKTVHLKERNYKCHLCDMAFSLGQTLRRHVERHKSEREPDFSCSICNLKYKDKSSLNRHNQSKHMYVRKFCEICGKMYSTNGNLLKHIRSAHPEKAIKLESDK